MRIRAARAANQFPRVLEDLRSGTIHLDAIMRLYPHLNSDNCNEVLEAASGASKREVLALVARIGPPEVAVERDVIRHLPSPPPVERSIPSSNECSAEKSDEVIPPPARIRLAFTADDEFLVMLERARSLRLHKFPSGRMEDVLKEAITVLLDRIDPDRREQRRTSRNPRAVVPKRDGSRLVPAAVKAEVWQRDGGCCAYEAEGRRCESRRRLEYDHIVPWALGGRSDLVGNIRLLCRPHNQRFARRRFGPRRRP